MKNLLFSLWVVFAGSTFSGPVFALDYSDHLAICKQIDANSTHALSNDEKGRQEKCMCEIAQLQKLAEPDMYRLMIDWRLDAKAFAKNNSSIIGKFLPDAMAVGAKAMGACS